MHPAAQSHPDAGKQIYRFSGLVQSIDVELNIN